MLSNKKKEKEGKKKKKKKRKKREKKERKKEKRKKKVFVNYDCESYGDTPGPSEARPTLDSIFSLKK